MFKIANKDAKGGKAETELGRAAGASAGILRFRDDLAGFLHTQSIPIPTPTKDQTGTPEGTK